MKNQATVICMQSFQKKRTQLALCEKRQSDLNKVSSAAAILLIAQHSEVWIGGRKWSFDDVSTQVACHQLYSKALARLIDGDDEPLRDLTIRVARLLACSILGICPESIGVSK